MNDNTPVYFQRRPVYVCCLVETSTGRLIDFRRIRLVVSNESGFGKANSSPVLVSFSKVLSPF